MTRPCGNPVNNGQRRCSLANGHRGECRPPTHRRATPEEILTHAKRGT